MAKTQLSPPNRANDGDEDDGDGKWMQDAFKPARKGKLHKALDVPVGQKIPSQKLAAAKIGKFGSKVAKMANPVVTAKNIASTGAKRRMNKRGYYGKK